MKKSTRDRSRCSAAASGPEPLPRARQPPARARRVRRGRRPADRGRVRAPRAARSSAPTAWFEGLGAQAHRPARCSTGATPRPTRNVTPLMRRRAFVYLSDGSPLHLRSVLKGSRALRRVLVARLPQRRGARGVGRGRDRARRPDGRPRGGAYTVGLGVVLGPRGLPVPRHRGRPPARALDRAARRATRCSPASTSSTALVRRPGQWTRGRRRHGDLPSGTVHALYRRRVGAPRAPSRLRDRHLEDVERLGRRAVAGCRRERHPSS